MSQYSKNSKRLVSRAIEAAKKKGIKHVMRHAIRKISHSSASLYIQYLYYKVSRRGKKFTFRGKSYGYFCNFYNHTWRNERIVEIPIIWDVVKSTNSKKILEVGNVLSHYHKIDHDVIDKYEVEDGIINEDVLTFDTPKRYDLIVSISTLEHVGWDEMDHEIDPQKIPKSLKNLERLLEKNGRLIVTMPIGYNPFVSNILMNNKILFSRMYFLKRISKGNDWVEAEIKDINNIKYNHPFAGANWLVVGFIEKL